MEAAFCQPEAGSTIEPQAGSSEVYAELEQKWVAALQDTFSLPNH